MALAPDPGGAKNRLGASEDFLHRGDQRPKRELHDSHGHKIEPLLRRRDNDGGRRNEGVASAQTTLEG
jgi:hypothetical protein